VQLTRSAGLRQLLLVTALLISGTLAFAYAAQLHWEKGWLRDWHGYVAGADFVNSWMMGHAALTDNAPQRYYDLEAYNAHLRNMVGDADLQLHQWSYPPSFMLPTSLIGWMPYHAALLLLCVVSVGALLMTVRRGCAADWKTDAATILCSPAAFIGFISGQIAMLATAVQLYLFQQMDRRPYLAGMLLGVLSVKPQIGLIYPFFLLATRRWKVFASAAITTLAMVILTALIWGVEVWRAYLEIGAPAQSAFALVAMTPSTKALMPTLFVDMRAFGASVPVAMGVQMLAACMVIAALLLTRLHRWNVSAQMLFVATGGVLLTPYLMAYDTLFLSAAIVLYLRDHAIDRWGMGIMGLTFLLPVLHFAAMMHGMGGTAMLPLGLFVWLITAHRSRA